MNITTDLAAKLAANMDGAHQVASRLYGSEKAPDTEFGAFDVFLSRLIQGAESVEDLADNASYFVGQLKRFRDNAKK